MTCPHCGTKLFLWIRLKGGGNFEYRVCCCRCEDLVAAGPTVEALSLQLNGMRPAQLQEQLTQVLETVSV